MATMAGESRERARASRAIAAAPSMREVRLIDVGAARPAEPGASFRWLGRAYEVRATECRGGRNYLHLADHDGEI